MKIIIKFIVGSLATSLLIILILLATVRFEILNKSFVFTSFEKHNVYDSLPSLAATSLPDNFNLSEQEKIAYTEFAKNISPQVVKPIIEDNLSQIIDYINGDSKNISLSFSLNGIGFENSSGLYWSPSQIPDKNIQEQIKAINGAGDMIIIAGLIIVVILFNLFFIYGKLTTPQQALGGKTMFISTGTYLVAAGLIYKFFINKISEQLMNGQDLMQKIFSLLLTSLFSEIITTWIVVGAILILIWAALQIITKIVLKSDHVIKVK